LRDEWTHIKRKPSHFKKNFDILKKLPHFLSKIIAHGIDLSESQNEISDLLHGSDPKNFDLLNLEFKFI
jgi:hypothetical protein